MAAKKRPAAEDRFRATRIALGGIAAGVDLPDVARELEPLHPKNDTFPGEVLLELAADALEEGGVSRDHPIGYEGIRQRYLSEQQFRGRTQHYRSHYALRAAAMIRAGVTPDLLDEVSWWDTNDLWIWSLYALVIYLRVAAERTGESVATICQRVAARRGVELTGAPDNDRPHRTRLQRRTEHRPTRADTSTERHVRGESCRF